MPLKPMFPIMVPTAIGAMGVMFGQAQPCALTTLPDGATTRKVRWLYWPALKTAEAIIAKH